MIGVLAAIAGRFPVQTAAAVLLGADICVVSYLYRLKFGRLDTAKGGE